MMDSTLLAAIVSIITSIVSTVFFNMWQYKKEVKQRLDDEFNDILKIAIE